MKTQFHWFLMTWTLGGLVGFSNNGGWSGRDHSNVTAPMGIMTYIGIALWIFGFSIEVIADKQKEYSKNNLIKKKNL